jgi:hypothetical protein
MSERLAAIGRFVEGRLDDDPVGLAREVRAFVAGYDLAAGACGGDVPVCLRFEGPGVPCVDGLTLHTVAVHSDGRVAGVARV